MSREPTVSVFMNRAQYEKGAALLVPNRHLATVLDLDDELMHDVLAEAQRIARAMIRAFGAPSPAITKSGALR